MNKTAREILDGGVSNDDRHTWLAAASVEDLYDYLRWVDQGSSWAAHGRDALNVVLAKENIKLQRSIKALTIWIFALTLVTVLIGIFQIRQNMASLPQRFQCPPLSMPHVEEQKNTSNRNTNTEQLNNAKSLKHE